MPNERFDLLHYECSLKFGDEMLQLFDYSDKYSHYLHSSSLLLLHVLIPMTRLYQRMCVPQTAR